MGDAPVCTIDSTGIHKPPFADVLAYYQQKYRDIYGQDIYLGNDSQDGQLLGLFATGLDDANAQTVDVYNSRGPDTAQGVGLSSIAKINGLVRKVPTYSVVDVTLIGQAGSTITNGKVTDGVNLWTLPTLVIIPSTGTITVSAVADAIGDVRALAGTITTPATPTKGWQEVSNPTDAVPGQPVESDAALRRRQALSTQIPSQSILEGMTGALLAVAGVTNVVSYENTDNVIDANGQPGHSLAFVIDGGTISDIATVIKAKKGPGVNTYGEIITPIVDVNGIPENIAFSRSTPVLIVAVITLRAFRGFTTDIQAQIAQSFVDWINALECGEDVIYSRLGVPLNLNGAVASKTYEILDVQIAHGVQPAVRSDISIAFTERAIADIVYVAFSVST